MARSIELTRGHRCGLFGLLLVNGLVGGVGNIVIGGLAIGLLGTFAGNLLVVVWVLLFMAFSAIAVTVTYHDPRIENEGGDVERLAEIFT